MSTTHQAESTSVPSAPTPELGSNRRLFGWLIPGRLDVVVLMGCVLIVAGFVDPFIEQQVKLGRYSPMLGTGRLCLALGLVAAGIAGLAVAAGWRKLDRSSALIILVSGILAIVAFTWSLAEVKQSWRLGFQFHGIGQVPTGTKWTDQPAFGFFGTAIGFGAVWFGGVFVATRAFAFLIDWLETSSKPSLKLSRTKVLIGLSVVLFAAKIVQDIFFPMGFLYQQRSTFGNQSPSGFYSVWLLGFVVFLLLPGWALTSRIKIRWKLLLLLGIGGGGIVSVIIRTNVIQAKLDSTILHSIYAGCVLFFLGMVWLASNQQLSLENQNRPHRRLSIWSIVPVLVVCLSGWICYAFDATTLARSYGENWSEAKLAKSVSRYSNYQVAMIDFWGGGKGVAAEITAATPDDVFSLLAGSPVSGVDISGLRPTVGVGALGNNGWTSLSDSQVSPSQLVILASSAATVSFFNVEIVDLELPVTLAKATAATFVSTNEVELTSLLQAVRLPNVVVANVRIDNRPPTVAELDAIVELGQFQPVTINEEIFEEMVRRDYRVKLSARNLFVDLTNDPLLGEVRDSHSEENRTYRYLCETDFSIIFDGSLREQFWDLAFVKGKQGVPNHWNVVDAETFSNAEHFHRDAIRYHWSFSPASEDKLTELFLPGIEQELDGNPSIFEFFQDVEVLSLDPAWLNQETPQIRYYRKIGSIGQQRGVQLDGIEQLVNLKRLDLNPWLPVDDQQFLSKIPRIVHLQIGFAGSCRELVDFSVCPQLQNLIHVGPLPKSSVKQLQSLKKLNSVIILSSESDMLSPNEISKMESSIPGVEVKVVSAVDFVPEPPNRFQQHVKRVSAEILNQLGVSKLE